MMRKTQCVVQVLKSNTTTLKCDSLKLFETPRGNSNWTWNIQLTCWTWKYLVRRRRYCCCTFGSIIYIQHTQINSGSSSFATFRVKLKHVGLARAQSAMLTRIISRSVYRRQGSTLRQTMPAAEGLALALYSVSEQSPIQMKQCAVETSSRFIPHSWKASNFRLPNAIRLW